MAENPREDTEVVLDTVRSELITKFKNCVDWIDVSKKAVNRENWEVYVKMNKILHNLRRLDPQWMIEGSLDNVWSLGSMLEGIFKKRTLEIDLSEIDSIDLEGYLELHQSPKEIREHDPNWSINKMKRNPPALLTPLQIGLQEDASQTKD